jgi:hypothetical protein
MAMNEIQRRAFNQRLDRAVEQMKETLRPFFSTGGVDHLPDPEAELLHETMFKLDMLRNVIVHHNVTPSGVHGLWLAAQARRARAQRRRDPE